MQYFVYEIKGRQYLIEKGKTILVDKLDGAEALESGKILLWVDDDKVEMGSPYLEKKAELELLDKNRSTKVRVATYKAKSNYRRVIGQRVIQSMIKMKDASTETKVTKKKKEKKEN